MMFGILNAISFIIAVVSMITFEVTNDIYFGVAAVLFMVMSAEFSILGAIEKTKEGR